MSDLTYYVYEFFIDELTGERQLHAVYARSVEEAVRFFMARYTGAYSDDVTQYQIQNHALVCIESVNDRHYRVEWGIEEHEIATGVLF